MARLLLCAALALFIACDKQSKKVPAATTNSNTPAEKPAMKVPDAPKGVPEELKALVQKQWPKIEELGNTFLAEFSKASTAKSAGDRSTMDKAVKKANEAYNSATEMWAEIVYWGQDTMSDSQIEACERYLSQWSRKVASWTKKAKGLKEFMRVG